MENTLSENDVVDILRGISIPPQPQIMADLQLAQAMGADIDEIAQLITRDVSLSGSLLKVANSPFYGLRRPVTSIEQAIMLVGVAAVQNIISGICLRQELIQSRRLNDDEMTFLNAFWDSAEDMAKVSALISRYIELEDPDLLYSLGLFHNASIPLLVQHLEDYRHILKLAYAQNVVPLTNIEDDRIQTNHAVLGYYLARSWKLPIFVCETIAEHHNLAFLLANRQPQGSPMLNMLAILKLAEHLVGLHAILGNCEQDLEWASLEADIVAYLNLSADDLDELRHQCENIGISNRYLS